MSAPHPRVDHGPCAGEVTPTEAWERLAADPAAILVDVRTRIELALTGGPDVSALGREPLFVEWMTQQGRNPAFMEELRAGLAARGAGPDTAVFFLCRTAGRSRVAAGELTAAGFGRAFNVAEGFEGDLDAAGHRNVVNGWKARGLPWRQS